MKNILLFLTCMAGIANAEVENNAYIYFDRITQEGMTMCIIYNGHYLTVPAFYHYEKCPCFDDD